MFQGKSKGIAALRRGLAQVDGARKERTLMEAKVKRLQTMLVNQQPQQEELIKSIHFLEHVSNC
jgi:hypothetical protein